MPEFIEDEDGKWEASGKHGRVLILIEPSQAWIDARLAEQANYVPPPDVPGFLLGVIHQFGKVPVRNFVSKYPDFLMALLSHDYAAAREAIVDARAAGVMTAGNVSTLGAIADEYHIP